MKTQSSFLFVFGAVVLSPLWIVRAEERPDDVTTVAANNPKYMSTDIEFHAHDGVDLLGRLVLPNVTTPRAVVIYVQTAEGATIDQKRPLGKGKTFNYFDVYRRELTKKNIGFFSYEGRGIRMGDALPRFEKIDWNIYNTSTLDNKVRDAIAAAEAVRKQNALQDIPIMLIGASEGTLIAAEAASTRPELIDGLVLYGVLATNLRENFKYIMSDGAFLQFRPLDKNGDHVLTKSEWAPVKEHLDFADFDKNGDGEYTVDDIKVSTQKYLDATDNDDFEVLQQWAKSSAGLAVPEGWFKDHFAHADNWSFLSKLDIPIGFFHGDMDTNTPLSAVKELEAKAKAAKHEKMEFHYFAGLDHSLNITEYFMKGSLPKGHQAIFDFIDRIAPNN